MPPTIHFVRHAQGYHNLCVENHNIRDPELTPYGKQQCSHLQQIWPYHNVDFIVASPLKRTVNTALLSFGNIISKKGLIVNTLPELQETSDLPCDTGLSRLELETAFAGQPVEFSRVEEGWNSKVGKWAPEQPEIQERAKTARRWLRSRPERDIVVVTHGALLHYLTDDWAGMNPTAGTGWMNTEFRTYTFDPSTPVEARLVETQESRTRRLGMEKPPSEAEQRNLKRIAVNEMERKGYQQPSEALILAAKV